MRRVLATGVVITLLGAACALAVVVGAFAASAPSPSRAGLSHQLAWERARLHALARAMTVAPKASVPPKLAQPQMPCEASATRCSERPCVVYTASAADAVEMSVVRGAGAVAVAPARRAGRCPAGHPAPSVHLVGLH